MALTLSELASHIGAELHGDENCLVSRITTLDKAQQGDVTFLYNRQYRKFLRITGASAVIIYPRDLGDCPVSALVTDDPYLAYARATRLLNPGQITEAGLHPSAWIGPDANVDPSAAVGPLAVIEQGVTIGANTIIGPGCVIGRYARIGDFTHLVANVTICRGVTVGRRGLIHPGAVIGADGFGLARDKERWLKVPQLGSVYIGDDVEIGANTTIDRGALQDTMIEDGVKLDNQVHIGHNVRIGSHTAISGCVGIAGSATIGKRCVIAGGVGIVGHITIADDVTVTAMSLVTKSIRLSGTYSSGWAAKNSRRWRRQVACVNRIEQVVQAMETHE